MVGVETPESIVRAYLFDNEQLLWSGRPAIGLRFAAADLFLVPFSLVWGGFAIFWNVAVWRIPAAGSGPFKLFGLPFLIIGLYFIAGRFFVDAWARSRTVHALTNRRAMVVRRLWGEQMLTAPIDHSVRLSRKNGKGGDVEFGYRPSGGFGRSQDMGLWSPALSSRVAFIGIPDAMSVYRLAQSGQD